MVQKQTWESVQKHANDCPAQNGTILINPFNNFFHQTNFNQYHQNVEIIQNLLQHLSHCCLSDCLLPVSVSYNCLTVVQMSHCCPLVLKSSIRLTVLYLLHRLLPVSLPPPNGLPVVYLSPRLPSNLWLYLVTGLPRNEEMFTLYFLCCTTHIFAGACKQRANYVFGFFFFMMQGYSTRPQDKKMKTGRICNA